MQERFDSEVLELIPHRPPMLLINQIVSLSSTESKARVLIDEQTPFYQPDKGVPTWIGLEYMGQTAALIAGFQQREGTTKPHRGFLMGSRKYQTERDYFELSENLIISCQEAALVGESLATFNCTIITQESEQIVAKAMLSVFRKPLD